VKSEAFLIVVPSSDTSGQIYEALRLWPNIVSVVTVKKSQEKWP